MKLDDTIEISDDDDEPTYYGSDFSLVETQTTIQFKLFVK